MSTAVTHENVDTLDEFDSDGLEDVFDGIAREHLGISGAEFIKRFDGDGFGEADVSDVRRNVPPQWAVGHRTTLSKRFWMHRC